LRAVFLLIKGKDEFSAWLCSDEQGGGDGSHLLFKVGSPKVQNFHQIHRFLKTLITAIVKDVFRQAMLPVFLSLLISYSLNNA